MSSQYLTDEEAKKIQAFSADIGKELGDLLTAFFAKYPIWPSPTNNLVLYDHTGNHVLCIVDLPNREHPSEPTVRIGSYSSGTERIRFKTLLNYIDKNVIE